MASATFKLAHHPDPSYGSWLYCRSTRCMNVGWWKSGNMQLKFSKKSFRRERHSFFGGSRLKIRRSKRSPKTSGFQYIHLFSSTDAEDIISWNDESPVFSLTHEIPFGEKIENPDDEPTSVSVNSNASDHTHHTNVSSFTTVIRDK